MRDIYEILSNEQLLKFNDKLKIFKKLLLFINYDCDNNKTVICNNYNFDDDLLKASKILNKFNYKNNYRSYYSMINTIKSYIPKIFRGPSTDTSTSTSTTITGGKRKNRKTKHAKRKNQKAKSRKNRK